MSSKRFGLFVETVFLKQIDPTHSNCNVRFFAIQVNTERFETDSRGINHTEGGWPKDVNPQEIEQVIRFRKKVEKEENYLYTMQHLTLVGLSYILYLISLRCYFNTFVSKISSQALKYAIFP